MRNTVILLFVLGLTTFFYQETLAQSNKSEKKGKSSTIKKKSVTISSGEENSQQTKNRELEKETTYLSPIRYVIVYNELVELSVSERRIELIMDKEQFNEANLIKIFDLIKKRFPSPFRLIIEVHTSLATIETPEEREKADSNIGRLTDKIFSHKTAFFIRFNDGRESFAYTINLSPYKRKTVVLVDKF